MRKLKWTAVIMVIIFIGLQFNTREHTNPPFDETKSLEKMIGVPTEVSARSPAPATTVTPTTQTGDGTHMSRLFRGGRSANNEGRAELNFSEWGTYGARMKKTRLSAICEQTKLGTMPLASYAMVHREVVLSAEEVKSICEWTEQEEKLSALAHP